MTTSQRELNTELQTWSRDGHVSPCIGILIVLVMFTDSHPPQPPGSTDEAQKIISLPMSSDMSTSKEVPTSSRNVPSMRAAQETGSKAPFVLPRNQSPVSQTDSSTGKNTINSRAPGPKVDSIASVQPLSQPSPHSAPPQDQQSVSVPLSLPHLAPAIANTASSRVPTPRGVLAGESHRDTPSRGAASESLTPADKDKARACSSDQIRTNPSASSRRPPLLPEHAVSAVDSPSRSQPVFKPRSISRFQSGNEGEVESEAKRTVNTVLREHRMSRSFLSI